MRAFVAALALTGAAHATTVYTGCPVPPPTYAAIYSATPGTLAALAVSASAQAKSTGGNVKIQLATGSYGAVVLQGYFGNPSAPLTAYDSGAGWVTVTPALGATPVLSGLTVLGANGWLFSGLTIQGLNTTGAYATGGSPTPDAWLVQITGPHKNIILQNNTLMSQPDTSGWSIADWIAKRSSGIHEIGGTCVAITGNSLQNIGFGIQTQKSSNVLIEYNVVNRFADDGIDYGSNNILIANNTITNSVEDGDGFHRDGMQGQPYDESTVISNVAITGNTVTRIADPSLKFPGLLQGIDEFDGIWQGVTVSGNNVTTNAAQGIAFYGVSGLTTSNNVLAEDNGPLLPCYGLQLAACQTRTVVLGLSTAPTIHVTKSKAGLASSGVSVTGNTASGYAIDLSTTGLTLAADTCAGSLTKCVIGIPIAGVMFWTSAPGTYAGVTIPPT